ncbi:amidohydrolase family protein [Microdochium nivale]|nr:amidohydrolase family protein [Microdochium nivale]
MPLAAFTNGRFFVAGRGGANHSFASCAVVDTDSGLITHVGREDDAQVAEAAQRHDMGGRVVLPGFVDGHMHLLMMGQSLQKCGLEACKNLADIQATIAAFAREHPAAERIMCKGWMHSMTDGKALASMLDGIDPRPIFIDSKDLHSAWCNSAALDELGVHDMPDPEGGTIHRDPDTGRASGYLTESAAVVIVWPHVAKVASMDEKLVAIQAAIDAYNAVGYTGLVEMAMDENGWEALQVLRQKTLRDTGKPLAMRFAVHWLVTPCKTEAENLAQVDRAIELSKQFSAANSQDCRIVGIKIICDGIIDGCTAALLEPYADPQATECAPIWSPAELAPVVRKADAAGLQCALHAIGDAAVRNAIDALEHNAQPGHRHRIEHLELASAADAARLGKLGITASIQPVHADPAILRAWPSLLGHERCGRAFAYKEFADGGAVLALGSDAPTAPHAPLRNLYTATTRRSAREPELEDMVNPHFALDLAAAVSAATEGSAYSCFAEGWAGSIATGKSADFAVVDMQWDKDKLLETRVVQTWFKGAKVFDIDGM